MANLKPGRLHGGRRGITRLLLGAIVATITIGTHSPARSESYPDRPIKFVVPWPAGGITDLAGRAFGQILSAKLNNPVIVENRPGATGIIGAQAVAHAAPDGYTLLLATAETHAINPFVTPKLPYDPVKDFVPIGAFAINPYALIARANFPAANLQELVATVKANPGHYTYSSAGLGSASQIAMEMFKEKTGLNILHIPYQGEAPAVTALMAGQVDFEVLPVGRAVTLLKSGKIKVYAVTTANRYADLSQVPTLAEEGMKNIVIANWFGIMAPANTPTSIVDKLVAAIAAAKREPQTAEILAKLGVEAFPAMSQPDFKTFIAREMARWGKVIKDANIHR